MPSATGIKAGKAFVLIEAIDQTGAILRRVSQRMGGFASKMTSIGRNAVMAAGAALIPVGLSTKVFANFDDTMRKVEARTSGTAAEMQALRKQAKELGRTTSFTATQVGDLMASLGQKGFSRSQIGSMTADVMNLARAAGSGDEGDTVLASDLVARTMRMFNLGAEQSTRIADVFAKGVNSSALSLETLADGFKFVGPLAKKTGLSLEETVAIVGQLGNVGIEGSMAGTAVRGMLISLGDSAKRSKFADMLKEMTGETIELVDKAGNLNKLTDILFEVGGAMQGLGSAQQLELLSQLFSSRQLVSGAVLSEGENPFGTLLEQLQDAAGTAARTSAEMDAGIGGMFRRFRSAVEGIAIALGASLNGALTSLGAPLTDALTKFATWIDQNQAIVTGITAAVAIVGAFGVAMLTAAGIIKLTAVALGVFGFLLTGVKLLLLAVTAVAGLATVAFGILQAMIVGVSAPMLVAVAAAAALASGLIALSGKISTTVNGAFGKLRETASGLVETFSKTIGGIQAALASGNLDQASAVLWAGLKLAWAQGVDGLMGTFARFASDLLDAWTKLKFGMAKIVGDSWDEAAAIFAGKSSWFDKQIIRRKAILKILFEGMSKDAAEEWERRQNAMAEARNRAPQGERDRERDKRHKDLDEMQAEEIARRAGKFDTGSAARQKAIEDAEAELGRTIASGELSEAAAGVEDAWNQLADMFKPGVKRIADDLAKQPDLQGKGPASSRAIPALMGLERGTVEAAKASIKGETAPLNKLLDVAKDQKDALNDQTAVLEDIRDGQARFDVVG